MTEQAPDLEKLEFPEMEPPELLFKFPDNIDRAPIKMTYGLEMDIRRMLPDPQAAMTLLLGDPVTQDYLIRRCLTDKKKIITDYDDLIGEDELEDLSPELRDEILMWAGRHALYFFAKRTRGVATLGVNLQQLLPTLLPQPLPSGSEASASSTPSDGPTG